MNRSWEVLRSEMKSLNLKDYPEDVRQYIDIGLQIYHLIKSNMGISKDDFEKILRQAEEMMSPFDPDKTYYRSLLTYFPENAAARYYKEHPETTLIIN